jgi:hypothetical protein
MLLCTWADGCILIKIKKIESYPLLAMAADLFSDTEKKKEEICKCLKIN